MYVVAQVSKTHTIFSGCRVCCYNVSLAVLQKGRQGLRLQGPSVLQVAVVMPVGRITMTGKN